MNPKSIKPEFDSLDSPKTLINGVKGMIQSSLIECLETARIDLTREIPPPPIAWCMVDPGNPTEELILGTLGNISTIIGKAKSRKTFFTGIAVSAALTNEVIADNYKGKLPKEQNHVVYFDTEQSPYHAQRTIKRICEQINRQQPANLTAYCLRSYSPSERLKLVDYAIEQTPNLGLVVIDGIRDLVNSINDETEATEISSLLLKWSEKKNIHIITILHQNKSDNNARGHIGTELINKSETVLSVMKSDQDEEISIVEGQHCRNREPKPFAFEIIDDIPVAAQDFELRTKAKQKGYDLLDLPLNDVFDLLQFEVFNSANLVGYGELVRKLKVALKVKRDIKAGDNRVKDLVSLCKSEGLICQEAKKKPYTLGLAPDVEDPF